MRMDDGSIKLDHDARSINWTFLALYLLSLTWDGYMGKKILCNDFDNPPPCANFWGGVRPSYSNAVLEPNPILIWATCRCSVLQTSCSRCLVLGLRCVKSHSDVHVG